MSTKVIPLHTRIAPSPTGFFHLGTARTAYFCWLAARATGGTFTVRIDDTDDKRNNLACIDLIYDCLDWLGLDWDHTFKQSESNYDIAMSRMLDFDYAYVDDDGTHRLWHVNLLNFYHDFVVGDVVISEQDKEIAKDMVLMRSDGSPTYHFASVVDDMASTVNLVLRGKDHISNTARQIAIMNALNDTGIFGKQLTFGHVGLILKDGKKLSKRDAGANLLEYRDAGYHPDAVLNFLLKMGWSANDPNIDKKMPLINKDDAIKMFLAEGHMRGINAKFDQNRLDWFNKKYKHRK